jgi:hypothetical protein
MRDEAEFGVRDWASLGMLSADGTVLVFEDAGVFGGPNYTVLMRKTDGSAAVRLGEGEPQAISPDGKFVLADIPSKPPRLMLYPTGAGETRQLDVGAFESIAYERGSLALVGEDLRFTFCGARPKAVMRCYLGSANGGAILPIAPEVTEFARLSPDGAQMLTRVGREVRIYSVSANAPIPAKGFEARDYPVRWAPGGHDVWVTVQEDPFTMQAYRVNPESGVRTQLKRVAAPPQSGMLGASGLTLADDPGVYAYGQDPYLSELYLVRGVKR